jgi:hypothetical protein
MIKDKTSLIPAYTGKDPFIFISYSHTDSERVQHFIRSLSEAGYRIWYDEGIKLNEDYQHTIQRRIREASYFIAFITNRYLTRKDPLQEMLIAMELRDKKKLKIISIVLEPYDLEDLEKKAHLFSSKTVEEAIGKLIYQGFKDIQGLISYENHFSSNLLTNVMSQLDDACRETSESDLWKKTVEEDTLEAYEKFLDESNNDELKKLAFAKIKKMIYDERARKEAPSKTEVGSILDGRYSIEKHLGKGGMATVYLAYDQRLGKHWAVKEIQFKQNPSLLQSLAISEIKLMNQFNHPSIPRIIDLVEGKESIFIIMDYFKGFTLDWLIHRKDGISEEVAIKLAIQLCEVLGYLHSRKPAIIYRDVKPSNIFIKEDGMVTLLDFGIAREYKEENRNDTVNLGTKGYAAPEQFSANSQTDARTDIYSLGITLYYLLTKHSPFESPFTIIPITQLNPKFSKGLEKIILKCTQPNPVDRYQSCEELLEELRNINNDCPLKKLFYKLSGTQPKDINKNISIDSSIINEYFKTTQQKANVAGMEDPSFHTEDL